MKIKIKDRKIKKIISKIGKKKVKKEFLYFIKEKYFTIDDKVLEVFKEMEESLLKIEQKYFKQF
jgi:hypothetical protein